MTFEVSGYEIAYTPKNLRIMLSRNIISQREAYEAIGVSRCMFYRYLRPYDHPNTQTHTHIYKYICTLTHEYNRLHYII